MPFKSKKQARFLAWKKPALYRKWKKRYGSPLGKKRRRKGKKR